MNLEDFIGNVIKLNREVSIVKMKIDIFTMDYPFSIDSLEMLGHERKLASRVLADLRKRNLVTFNSETKTYEVNRNE